MPPVASAKAGWRQPSLLGPSPRPSPRDGEREKGLWLATLVGLDVVVHRAGLRAAAVWLLFVVFDFELGEVEAQVFAEHVAVARSAVLHAGNQNVSQLDLEVFQRLVAS